MIVKIHFRLNILLLIFVMCIIFPSCRTKIEENSHLFSKVKIDTLIIDSGDELIYLKDNLDLSISLNDSSILFIFNPDLLRLEKINLENGTLEKITSLDREGPQGVGDWHIGLVSYNDSLLVLEGDNTLFFLNREGDFLRKLSFEHIFFNSESLHKKFVSSGLHVSNTSVYLIIQDWNSNESFLLIYKFKEDSFELYEIPESHLAKSGAVNVMIEKSSIRIWPRFSINPMKDGIAISNKAYPQLVYFNDSFNNPTVINPKSKFFNVVSPIEVIPEVYSISEEEKFKIELEKRMNFLPPIWDRESKRIFRWGYKIFSKKENLESPKYDNYLFVIGSNNEIIREFRIPDIHFKPHKYYLIDNKIYLYHNFGDELGFIRLHLDDL